MKNYDNRLEDLLHEYSFDQLSNSDKDYVLSEMSAFEYNHLHKIVHVAKHEYTNTELNLPPKIKTSIKKSLDNKWNRPKTWTTMLMPFLWISLGALLTYFIKIPNNNHAVQNPMSLPLTPVVDTVYIEIRDTIIKEIEAQPIIQIKEIIRYRDAKVKVAPKAAPIDSMSNQDKYVNSMPNELAKKLSLDKPPTFEGKSISKEEELMDLLTPIPTDGLE